MAGSREGPLRRCVALMLVMSATLLVSFSITSPASADQPDGPGAVPVESGPAEFTRAGAIAYAKTHPNASPMGANDFDCVPSSRHPQPVVLLHGTDSSAYSDWAALSPQLAASGFCVYALNFGGRPGDKTYGNDDIAGSSAQFGDFVNRVLASTGADKIDVVGYSQGATVARYYINRLGGAPNVRQWIGVASPTYGGVMYGTVPLAQAIPGAVDALTNVVSVAVIQQMQGSAFLSDLNRGSDTVPGVGYTTIGSRFDEMIQPSDNIALRGPNATNAVVQDLCPGDATGHVNMVYDPFTLQLVQKVLDPASAQPKCEFVPLGTGIPEVIWGAHS